MELRKKHRTYILMRFVVIELIIPIISLIRRDRPDRLDPR
jgi:hypothetical protein